MKKKIEAELVKLAEKIVKEKGKLDAVELKEQARNLYEKLCVLSFTEMHLKEETPKKIEPRAKTDTTEEIQFEAPQPAAPVKEKKEQEQPSYDEFAPDGTQYNDTEAITEPNTEKIKDIVAQMPPESQRVDSMIEQINTPEVKKPEKPTQAEEESTRDFRNIGVDYDNLPDFQPVNNRQRDQKPKSLNDRLKKGINIGLNERLTYIKHLFDGNTADYNRVLSQLNTFSSLEEAQKFIQLVVKPDYKHWEGKEEYEKQFMEKVENKFAR